MNTVVKIAKLCIEWPGQWRDEMKRYRVGVEGKPAEFTQHRLSSSKEQDSTKLVDEHESVAELMWVDPMEQEDIWKLENYS